MTTIDNLSPGRRWHQFGPWRTIDDESFLLPSLTLPLSLSLSLSLSPQVVVVNSPGKMNIYSTLPSFPPFLSLSICFIVLFRVPFRRTARMKEAYLSNKVSLALAAITALTWKSVCQPVCRISICQLCSAGRRGVGHATGTKNWEEGTAQGNS